MTGYILSPLARQDIIEIIDYIAADNLAAALRLRDRLFIAFDLLDNSLAWDTCATI